MNTPEIKETLAKQVAALAMSGKTAFAISKELKISRYAVNKIVKSKEFKDLITEIGDAAIEVAKSYVKNQLSELTSEAVTALREVLNTEGKSRIEAVKVVFRGLGVLDPKENKDAQGNISIIMPIGKEERSIPSTVIEPDKGE